MTGLLYRLTAVWESFKVGGMSTRAEFYQDHLDQVSRSFAFCIRQLPNPLREWVSLSYLLCRTLDTIEDASWKNRSEQFAAFSLFDQALKDKALVDELGDWAARFPSGVPAGEQALLNDAAEILRDFHALPGPVADIIRDVVSIMSAGMQHFCNNQSSGVLRLRSLAEVNQYCFFVAGVVGELLAKVLAKVEPRFALSQLNILRAHHFGLFLQKVNLLKDQVADEQEGRHLVPSRESVEASSEENARQALKFLLDIPGDQVEFRRFCAWSLFLGLESLVVSRKSRSEKTVLKVARSRTDEILSEVEKNIQNDQGLKALFARAEGALGWMAHPVEEAAEGHRELPPWLLSAYRGCLKTNYLHQLGMTS